MISSPGCQCLKAGASGLISTRFWIITRPGTLRSCSWRSTRVIPGACGAAVLMSASVSPKRMERGAQLVAEELRLLPGGEVAAAVDLVDVGQSRVGAPRPRLGRPEGILSEDGDADGDTDLRGLHQGCACRARPAVLPVEPAGRG